MIYRAPETTNTVRRHCQRACAVKVGGMWIDKDDLHTGARQCSGMTIVHACQWTGTGNLCGMWIITTKPVWVLTSETGIHGGPRTMSTVVCGTGAGRPRGC